MCKKITDFSGEKPSFKLIGDRIKVVFANVDDYRNVTKKLNDHKIDYYIINPISKHPIKVLIKGLPRNMSIDTIKNELISQHYEVEKVAQLRSFRDRQPLPMFQIQLTPEANVDKIYEIKTMFFLDVEVVKYEKPNRVNQCHRCQNFGHSSTNCQMQQRCVKCGKDHITADCQQTQNEAPTCANCNGPHPASWRGCKLFPKPTFRAQQPRIIKLRLELPNSKIIIDLKWSSPTKRTTMSGSPAIQLKSYRIFLSFPIHQEIDLGSETQIIQAILTQTLMFRPI